MVLVITFPSWGSGKLTVKNSSFTAWSSVEISVFVRAPQVHVNLRFVATRSRVSSPRTFRVAVASISSNATLNVCGDLIATPLIFNMMIPPFKHLVKRAPIDVVVDWSNQSPHVLIHDRELVTQPLSVDLTRYLSHLIPR